MSGKITSGFFYITFSATHKMCCDKWLMATIHLTQIVFPSIDDLYLPDQSGMQSTVRGLAMVWPGPAWPDHSVYSCPQSIDRWLQRAEQETWMLIRNLTCRVSADMWKSHYGGNLDTLSILTPHVVRLILSRHVLPHHHHHMSPIYLPRSHGPGVIEFR